MDNEQLHRVEQQLAAFALDSFRPGQQDVITTVLSGQDCLCIMPTGGGKSLCYQLPAVMQDGVALVISPLIALMKDQVDSMRELGMRATLINSTLDTAEQNQRIQEMAAGRFDLVYIAPERLRSPRFLEAVARTQVTLLAIDEAHCISQWGHDFRPDYARLGELRKALGNPPTIALTATATPPVRQDIVAQLQLREPKIFITGFARPNLHFEVVSAWSNAIKDRMLLDFLDETPGAGIVYAATRRRSEELAELLASCTTRTAAVYHAGMPMEQRREVQEAFMRGDHQVVVATNAFGMGIDKSDLRFVVHYNMPGSLEAYYQEAGRAGRDGQPSRCLLLYAAGDRRIQEFFIENAYPSRSTIAHVYQLLCRLDEDPIELTQQDLKERLSLEIGGEGVGACEQILEKCGAIERLSTQENRASVRIDSELPNLVELLPREARAQRQLLQAIQQIVGQRRHERVYFPLQQLTELAGMKRDAAQRALRELRKLEAFNYVPPFRGRAIHVVRRDRPFHDLEIDFAEMEKRKANEFAKLDQVDQYARSGDCRQYKILVYFGDPAARPCGGCDNCGGVPSIADEPPLSGEIDDQLLQCVRIALSGVARVQGRVGKLMVARMLCGSQSKQISKLRLDELSTFGLLAELKQTEATALLDALLQGNLIQQRETHHMRPVVGLTATGRQVMAGQRSLDGKLRIAAALRARLQSVRLPNRTASRLPPLPEQPEELSGRSAPDRPLDAQPAPAADTAAQLEADLHHSEMDDAPDDAAAHRTPTPAGTAPAARAARDAQVPPDWFWTWRVFAADCELEECQAIRQLDRDVILSQLIEAAGAGRRICLAWALDAAQRDQLAAWAGGAQQVAPSQLEALLDDRQREVWPHCRGRLFP